jgi:hypothetical protein
VLSQAVHAERVRPTMLLVVCFLNIVLAVWRPRLLRNDIPQKAGEEGNAP